MLYYHSFKDGNRWTAILDETSTFQSIIRKALTVPASFYDKKPMNRQKKLVDAPL